LSHRIRVRSRCSSPTLAKTKPNVGQTAVKQWSNIGSAAAAAPRHWPGSSQILQLRAREAVYPSDGSGSASVTALCLYQRRLFVCIREDSAPVMPAAHRGLVFETPIPSLSDSAPVLPAAHRGLVFETPIPSLSDSAPVMLAAHRGLVFETPIPSLSDSAPVLPVLYLFNRQAITDKPSLSPH
jgi:hypothetical protein